MCLCESGGEEEMNCFGCCRKPMFDENQTSLNRSKQRKEGASFATLVNNISFKSDASKQRAIAEEIKRIGEGGREVQTFTFRELAAATKNFRTECLLGEGGFGRVYRGCLENTNQVVAVKQLDRNGLQGNREFVVEVLMLSLLHHPNLVNLIGYCTDGDQRILVYEYMALGSLEDHLLDLYTENFCISLGLVTQNVVPSLLSALPWAIDIMHSIEIDFAENLLIVCTITLTFADLPPKQKPLDWFTRMKIARGAAKGLEYLHESANPPVIYRDFKASNILLDKNFDAKLSDFGLAKLGPTGDKTHVSTRVMGTYGYCAPEYAMTGQLTTMSDVYSFGVVFLEIITGRRVIDSYKPTSEQNLVQWAQPLFKDRRRFAEMADPLLQGNYPLKGLHQALGVAAMCLQEDASTRPLISDVVTALEYLVMRDTGQDKSSKDPLITPGRRISNNKSRSFNRDDSLHPQSSIKEE